MKKRQEEYDNYAELANMVSCDLLTENPDQAMSQFGPHRVVPDRWKGMNEDQLRRIREEQQKQIEEKKVKLNFFGLEFYHPMRFIFISSVVLKKNNNVKMNGIDDDLLKLKLEWLLRNMLNMKDVHLNKTSTMTINV